VDKNFIKLKAQTQKEENFAGFWQIISQFCWVVDGIAQCRYEIKKVKHIISPYLFPVRAIHGTR